MNNHPGELVAVAVVAIVIALWWATKAAPKANLRSQAGYDNILRVAAGVFGAYVVVSLLFRWVR